MGITIALAGNPNCGKTTLFNALTGSNQFVGNWPGVTVEKKEGKLKDHNDVTVSDLPGIYSLSPYSPEEVVARKCLLGERPDVILNIIDASNLERNLYLTTQLTELGIPVVVALNMMDVVRKNGDTIDTEKLSEALGCRIVEISALKSEGLAEAAETAIKAAENDPAPSGRSFSDIVEDALGSISAFTGDISDDLRRWYTIKLFERDEKIIGELKLNARQLKELESEITAVEKALDDDAEAIITNERYNSIERMLRGIYIKKHAGERSASDKIDRIIMHRWLGLPIFALVMIAVYFISVSTIGSWAVDWANDGLFGDGWFVSASGKAAYNEDLAAWEASSAAQELACPEPSDYKGWVMGIPKAVELLLDKANCSGWLKSLILDGMIGGVGSVLGFVPQLMLLFIFLAILEACGYMARVAFMLDRVFRRFGLSGKSFIPILIGTGCGVPGIMASRTIENPRDRRMTIITTTFIPCGAKLPVISMIAATLFGGAWWVGASAYFMGITAILISGVILKKTKLFAGESTPFVMELPAYHLPTVGSVLHSMWERISSFIQKAGTVILLASVIIWAGSHFGWEGGSFVFSTELDLGVSILGRFGNAVKWVFAPLGFDNAAAAIATVMGLAAKEEIVGVFGVLDSDVFTKVSGYAFLAFNLLCAPCFAAMGAIRREMNSPKWTAFAIGYQCTFAYITSFCIFQLGSLSSGNGSLIGSITAFTVIAVVLYLIFRPVEETFTLRKKSAPRR